jgi:hypothetical protein
VKKEVNSDTLLEGILCFKLLCELPKCFTFTQDIGTLSCDVALSLPGCTEFEVSLEFHIFYFWLTLKVMAIISVFISSD